MVKNKLVLTFEVLSQEPLSREYVRKVAREIRKTDGRLNDLIEAIYLPGDMTNIEYVALEATDRWKLEKAE